jgi:predicted O-linked N-acetylglucosamine transferase (SPINDLY family)
LIKASRWVAGLPRRELQSQLVDRVFVLTAALRAARVDVVAQADRDEIALEANGWGGALARMLIGGAWQSSSTPGLNEVPDAYWGAYADWLFELPNRALESVETERLAAHLLKHNDELARWVDRNLGSASVRAAADAYLKHASLTRLASATPIRQLAERRAHILARLFTRSVAPHAPFAEPRAGRRLRVGVICRDFDSSPETLSWAARVENLDPTAFEVVVFTLRDDESPLSRHLRSQVLAIKTLSSDLSGQIELLRNAAPDVLVFAGSIGGSVNDFTRLALVRSAPLQVLLEPAVITSGSPEMDLIVGSAEARAERFTERLAIPNGAALAFSLQHAAANEEPVFERENLGIPTDAVLLAAVLDERPVSRETITAWTSVLARAPQARLLLYFTGGRAHQHVAQQFCQALSAALGQANLATDRAHIFASEEPSHAEARALLRLAQIYLTPLGHSAPFWSAEALALSVPVIATNEMSALVQSAALDEVIAPDEPSYVSNVVRLANDTTLRTDVAAKLATQIERGVSFMDTLAASDAFGALLESAFDELCSLGRKEFQQQSEAVRCFGLPDPSETIDAGFAALERGDVETAAMEANLALRSAPDAPRARHLHGLVLHAQGNASRAVTYLIAALQGESPPASLWYALALALRDNGQIGEAIKALETCIRMDDRNVEALLILLELAQGAGAAEIAADVMTCLQSVAPDDPRVLAAGLTP